MSHLLVVALLALVGCNGKPFALQLEAARALDCSRDEILFDYDDEEGDATALCGNRVTAASTSTARAISGW